MPTIVPPKFCSICCLSVINFSAILFLGAGPHVSVQMSSFGSRVTAAGAEAPLSPDRSAQVLEHPELPQEDRHRNVAVEGHHLPVLQMKDVTAWGVHLLVRRRNRALRNQQVSLVCTV